MIFFNTFNETSLNLILINVFFSSLSLLSLDIVTTVAGNDTLPCYNSGCVVDGPAMSAVISYATDMAFDGVGNMYFSENYGV